ncbi:MmcB family DNA repair protein [Roseovarius sp. E0-M6]|uniref:MmcB family DNA repair protein n=1 Tax=Roseovarius sp. E0-M6 TaxID=3127118 RepID=UPI00300FB693
MESGLTPQHVLMPGQLLARGVARYLRELDFVSVEEFTPERGKRVDVMALGPKGEIWVIECKSSRADFQADAKWHGYLEWCDRFFWAVDETFPTDLLPGGTGLIIADAYQAEMLRMGPLDKLPGARRGVLTRKIARHAALRLQTVRDPHA